MPGIIHSAFAGNRRIIGSILSEVIDVCERCRESSIPTMRKLNQETMEIV
jgi:hypothetical protein